MAKNGRMSGWIAFAGWMLLVIGALDFFEGLIAVIRGQYYVLTPTADRRLRHEDLGLDH